MIQSMRKRSAAASNDATVSKLRLILPDGDGEYDEDDVNTCYDASIRFGGLRGPYWSITYFQDAFQGCKNIVCMAAYNEDSQAAFVISEFRWPVWINSFSRDKWAIFTMCC